MVLIPYNYYYTTNNQNQTTAEFWLREKESLAVLMTAINGLQELTTLLRPHASSFLNFLQNYSCIKDI